MTRDFYYYEPRRGHGLAHDPLKAMIDAKPTGWVSSLSSAGEADLTPYHFFDAFSRSPLVMGFFGNESNESIRNIAQAGEFSWNLAERAGPSVIAPHSAAACVVANELAKAALTLIRSRNILAGRIAESAVSLECRLMRLVRLQGITGRVSETWLILGEVVAVHMDAALIAGHATNGAVVNSRVEGNMLHRGKDHT
jgi:flavin reductase (DIM6/NTAB) family NADH-FMN oxidoreductase RutF